MSRMSLNRKLWLSLALVWLGLLGVGLWSAVETRSTMLAERKAGMVNLVDAAQGVVSGYYAQSQSGKMSEADAQREALARLATMRYGDSGYLFVMDSKPVVLMHPTLPQMTGKPVGDFKDPDGKLLYVAIVDAAKASGRGFAQYRGRLPHSETAVPKISYVVRFAPWDWNITSGVFIKDIDTVYYETLLGHLIVVLVIGAVITFAMLLIIRNVRASLGGEPDQAARLAASIAQGDLTQVVEVRPDDTTSMMAAMHEMQNRLHGTIGEIRAIVGVDRDGVAADRRRQRDLSSRTEQQAASLEETASSMEELTATVKQNADNARQANELAATRPTSRPAAATSWPGGRHDGRDQRQLVEQDRRHHRRDRRHRVPDQYPGAERGGGSGARRRAGPRLRGGRHRGAQPGAALGDGGQGNQGADRRLGRAGSNTGTTLVEQAGATMDEIVARAARHRHHGRDHGGVGGAEHRHRAGQPGHHADGRGDAAERRAGRAGGGRGRVAAGSGGAFARYGERVSCEWRSCGERAPGCGTESDAGDACGHIARERRGGPRQSARARRAEAARICCGICCGTGCGNGEHAARDGAAYIHRRGTVRCRNPEPTVADSDWTTF